MEPPSSIFVVTVFRPSIKLSFTEFLTIWEINVKISKGKLHVLVIYHFIYIDILSNRMSMEIKWG